MLAKEQSERSPKRVQKAVILVKPVVVSQLVLQCGTKAGRCTRQGKRGSSHSLAMTLPVLNGTSLWDAGFQANHLSKCFIRFALKNISRFDILV